ncbi:hypothetical protein KAU32_02250, partial [bacterium]|nr:hypothetical protein [bacterium]
YTSDFTLLNASHFVHLAYPQVDYFGLYVKIKYPEKGVMVSEPGFLAGKCGYSHHHSKEGENYEF